jgi:F-type H+-transporting ATPase subunit alpha
LKLFLAQYREVAAFAQFGSDLDAATQFLLNRGARLTELLKQAQYRPLPVEHQVVILFSGVHGFLDKLDVKKVTAFEAQLVPFITENHPDVFEQIRTEGAISDALNKQLKDILSKFVASFN